MINTKIERRKFKLKKMASRSKRLSLERATKFGTASDNEEFSEIESSESKSDSDASNSDYRDVSEENFGGSVKYSFEVEHYWCYYDINTSLEISWTPIVANENIEGKIPENSYFQFFVMTSLWSKIFEVLLKRSFYQVFGHILWTCGFHYTFWWKLYFLKVKISLFFLLFFLFFIFLKKYWRQHLFFFRLIFPFFCSSLY